MVGSWATATRPPIGRARPIATRSRTPSTCETAWPVAGSARHCSRSSSRAASPGDGGRWWRSSATATTTARSRCIAVAVSGSSASWRPSATRTANGSTRSSCSVPSFLPRLDAEERRLASRQGSLEGFVVDIAARADHRDLTALRGQLAGERGGERYGTARLDHQLEFAEGEFHGLQHFVVADYQARAQHLLRQRKGHVARRRRQQGIADRAGELVV